jgi:hypothetical protein
MLPGMTRIAGTIAGLFRVVCRSEFILEPGSELILETSQRRIVHRRSLILLRNFSFRKISGLDQDFGSCCRHSVVRGRGCWGVAVTTDDRAAPGFCRCGPMAWPGWPAKSRTVPGFERRKVAFAREGWSELGRDAVPLSSHWRPRPEGTLVEVANPCSRREHRPWPQVCSDHFRCFTPDGGCSTA